MGEFIDKLKGKAKQVEGDLTGDRSRHAEGRVDETKGKAKGAFEDVKQDAKRAIDRVEDKEKHE